jgi:hypothetical protein
MGYHSHALAFACLSVHRPGSVKVYDSLSAAVLPRSGTMESVQSRLFDRLNPIIESLPVIDAVKRWSPERQSSFGRPNEKWASCFTTPFGKSRTSSSFGI